MNGKDSKFKGVLAFMNLDTLCKSYKKTTKKIAEVKAVLAGNISGKSNIAEELTKGIQSYLKQASETLQKIIRISKGELFVQGGRIYHKDVKKEPSITLENAYEVTKKGIANVNTSAKHLSAKGYNTQALRVLGEGLVSLYAVYDNVEKLEKKFNANVTQNTQAREEAQKELEKLEGDLNKVILDAEKYSKSQKNKYAEYTIDDYLKNPLTPDYHIPLGTTTVSVDEEFLAFIKKHVPDFKTSSGESVDLSRDCSAFFFETDDELLEGSFFDEHLMNIIHNAYLHFEAKNLQIALVENKINQPVLAPIMMNIGSEVSSTLLFNMDIADDKQKINNLLDDLVSELNFRVTKIKAFRSVSKRGYCNSIYDYNAENGSNPFKFIFFIYKDFSTFPEDKFARDNLLKIIKDGANVGIFTLLIGKNVEVSCGYSQSDKFPKLDFQELGMGCIEVSKKKATFNGITFSFQKRVFENLNYLKLLSARIKESANFFLGQILEDEKDVPYYECIKVPIGDADGKRLYYECSTEKAPFPFNVVTGSTGSGKSAFVHTLMLSAAYKYSPQEVEIHLIDFKSASASTDFDGYRYIEGKENLFIPHIKYVSLKSRPENAVDVTNYIIKLIAERSRFGKFQTYNANAKPKDRIPQIFVIIDEYENMLKGGDGGDDTSIEKINLITQIKNNLTTILKRARVFGIGVIFVGQDYTLPTQARNQINNRYVFYNDGGDNAYRNCLPSAYDFSRFPTAKKEAQGYCYVGLSNDSNPAFAKMAFAGKVDGNVFSEQIFSYAKRIREKYPEETAKHVQTVIGGSGSVIPTVDSYKNWDREIDDIIQDRKMAYDSDEDFYSSGAEHTIRLMRPLAIGQSASSKTTINLYFAEDEKLGYYAFASRQGLCRLESNLALSFLFQTYGKKYPDKRIIILDASFDGIKEDVIDAYTKDHPFIEKEFEYVRGYMNIAQKIFEINQMVKEKKGNPYLVILHGLDFLGKSVAPSWLRFDKPVEAVKPEPQKSAESEKKQAEFNKQLADMESKANIVKPSLIESFMKNVNIAGLQGIPTKTNEQPKQEIVKEEPKKMKNFILSDLIQALTNIYRKGSRSGIFFLVCSENHNDLSSILFENMRDIKNDLIGSSVYGSYNMVKTKKRDDIPNANIAYVFNNDSSSTARLYNYQTAEAESWWANLEKKSRARK